MLTMAVGMAFGLVGCHDDDASADPASSVGTTTGASGDDASSSGDSSSSTGAAGSPYDGDPLEITRDGTWEWFDIDGIQCADGRPSGVGVRAVPDPAGLVVYFKGGGACFNATSCGISDPLMLTGMEAIEENPDGVLDFDDPQNPLAGYDIVYLPYCTGDVHGGTAPTVEVTGVPDARDFVGHDNVLEALQRVAPTFTDASRLLVLGTSAGGIGALLNFPVIAQGWPQAERFLLDDSGMIFGDEYLAPCLQRQMRDTWGLAEALPQDCPECETADGGGMGHYWGYLADRFPETHFGVVASTRDSVVRIFFGFGNEQCQPGPGLPDLGEATLMAALDDLRGRLLAERVATYVVDSDQHVWTSTPQFYSTETDGMALAEWFDAFLAGDAPNVGL